MPCAPYLDYRHKYFELDIRNFDGQSRTRRPQAFATALDENPRAKHPVVHQTPAFSRFTPPFLAARSPATITISTHMRIQDERRGAREDPHGHVVPGGHTGGLGASRRPGGSNTPAPGLSMQNGTAPVHAEWHIEHQDRGRGQWRRAWRKFTPRLGPVVAGAKDQRQVLWCQIGKGQRRNRRRNRQRTWYIQRGHRGGEGGLLRKGYGRVCCRARHSSRPFRACC